MRQYKLAANIVLTMCLMGVLTLALVAFAEIAPIPALSLDNVSTNATASTATTENFVYGEVYAIVIELESGGMTCDVAIVTQTNTIGDIETTILSLDNVSSSGRYRPRFATHSASAGSLLGGETNAPFALYQDNLILRVTDCCATAKNMNAVILLDSDIRH